MNVCLIFSRVLSSVIHVAGGAGWEPNATVAEKNALFESVSQLTGLLRDAMPYSGAYWNEADYLEPEWQQSFWGDNNYARLQMIKEAYDPSGVFSCNHCVELP